MSAANTSCHPTCTNISSLQSCTMHFRCSYAIFRRRKQKFFFFLETSFCHCFLTHICMHGKFLNPQSFLHCLRTICYFYFILFLVSLSSIKMSCVPRLHQDFYSYRPRHANIAIDSEQYTIPDSLPQRPKNFNTFGKECPVMLNTFNVIKTPSTKVFQYDVSPLNSTRIHTY